ncbi:hypothetical protein [Sphingomonas japonica]|uniref:Lipoprotein n=2 Tax=Sphingomonas japonica TaxID=511662 RepID=A0ABX0U8R8_9SPHN|nr:hypothetical protein [Sphingomonas japonica]NIJ25202.1 hypothetical protein [Sphingomonas japonica]
MKSTVALLAATLLSGCVTTQERPAVEGPVGIGQTAYVDGPRVHPLRVVEDSRCPMNARCVWAGRVVVRAAVVTGLKTRTMDLMLGEPMRVADGMLTLVSVTPDRMAGTQPTKREDYHFVFEFSGGL